MRINKNQFSMTSFFKNIRFHYNRGRGHLLSYIYNRIVWHYFPRLGLVTKFPNHVDIEISTICNMKCPMCYRRTAEFKRRVKQCYMDFRLFKKIIDECVYNHVYSIRLSLRGEPFIHPEIIKMVAYAREKDIKEISTLTNLLALDEDKFKKIMDLKLDWLTISFDGINETYEQIRKPAKFKKSYEKIKKFKEIKDRNRSKKPVIKVQTIWPAIKENPEEFINTFSPYVDHITVNPLIDYLHTDKDIIYYKNGYSCPVLWQRCVIGADGQVLLCCNDEMGKEIIGDVNKNTIKEIWHNPKINRIRRLHKAKKAYKELEICKKCHFPRVLVEENIMINGKKYLIKRYLNRSDKIGS